MTHLSMNEPAFRFGAFRFGLLMCLVLLLAPKATTAEPILIKLGTVAPTGSAWHDALLEIRQKWHKVSNGEIELRIYPGGVLGGETEMVRKVQRGGLDAITISASGLNNIDNGMDCLALPLIMESYEELDYLRNGVTPALERLLEGRNFKLVHWAEGGWIYLFSKRPIRVPDDLRRQRLWTGTGQPHLEKLFKDFGFRVVPLPATEMLTGLQTGLIDAIDVPPLFALLDSSYQVANHMLDVRWMPLNAATVMSKRKWDEIPASYRPKLLETARAVARDLREVNRRADTQAIEEMKARGLNVVTLTEEESALWQTEAEKAMPRLRGSYIDAELYDAVMRLQREYRSRPTSDIAP